MKGKQNGFGARLMALMAMMKQGNGHVKHGTGNPCEPRPIYIPRRRKLKGYDRTGR